MRFDVVLSDVVLFGAVLSDVVRFGVVLSDVVRFGVVLSDVVCTKVEVENSEAYSTLTKRRLE